MGYDGETRGMADIGRSIMKTASDLSKIRGEDALPSQAMMQSMGPMPAPANDVTTISVNVEMSGTLVSPDNLHIAGKIEGNVRAAAVTVCATGMVRGDIVAETVIVHGAVEGRIYGAQVQLAATANVRGDIFHGALGIDTNATFEGASRRLADVMAEAPMFTAASEAA